MSNSRKLDRFWDDLWSLIFGDKFGDHTDGNLFDPRSQGGEF